MADGEASSRTSSAAGQTIDGEAERSLLGACLSGGRAAVEDALEVGVRGADFCAPRRAAVWESMVRLTESDRHVDVLTVMDDLMTAGLLDAVGGSAALSQLDLLGHDAMAGVRARQVLEGAAHRRISEAAQIVHRSAVERDTPAAELLSDAQEAFLGLNERAAGQDTVVDRKAAVDRVIASAGKDAPGALPTGFRNIDSMLRGGLRPGHLVLIAARPAMGKTAFALAIGAHVADEGVPVGFVSLEMTGEELVEREIAAAARAPVATWGRRDEGSRAALAGALVCERPLHLIDRAGLTIAEVCAAARRLRARHGIGMLIVDHLGLIRASDRYAGNRVQEVAEISLSLRALSSHLGIPVVALSQLNRAVEARVDKRPNLSDLRDSGSLEQDANVVMLLHRPEYYAKDADRVRDEDRGVCEVIVAKNRGGATGTVRLRFDAPTMRFTSNQEAAA